MLVPVRASPVPKKERKKTDNPREGWENGTPKRKKENGQPKGGMTARRHFFLRTLLGGPARREHKRKCAGFHSPPVPSSPHQPSARRDDRTMSLQTKEASREAARRLLLKVAAKKPKPPASQGLPAPLVALAGAAAAGLVAAAYVYLIRGDGAADASAPAQALAEPPAAAEPGGGGGGGEEEEEEEEEVPRCAVCGSDGRVGLMRCKGCREVHYCSEACQKEHWKVHKPACRAAQRAAAAAAAEATAEGQGEAAEAAAAGEADEAADASARSDAPPLERDDSGSGSKSDDGVLV